MYKYFYQIKFVGSDRIRFVCVTTNYIERDKAKEMARQLVFKAFGHLDFEITVAMFQTLINRIQFDDDGIEIVNEATIAEQKIRIESLVEMNNNQRAIIEAMETQFEDWPEENN